MDKLGIDFFDYVIFDVVEFVNWSDNFFDSSLFKI